MKNPTLYKTSWRYLKGKFIFDFISSILANSIYFFSTTDEAEKWVYRLRLFRFVRIAKVHTSTIWILAKLRGVNTKNNDFVLAFISVVLYNLLAVHVLSCIWIWLGGLSVTEYTTNDPDSNGYFTWMFISQGAIKGDGKPLYDQYYDNEITWSSIYLFALEFVTTALTTVGFGSHSYQTNTEYIFVCVLEMMSAIYTALLISITVRFNALMEGFQFTVQVTDIMNSRDEWLFYKVQRLGKPYYLSSSLSKRI